MPPVVVERDGARVFEVPLKNVRSFYTYLALVGRRVVLHFRDVGQLHQVARHGRSHVFRVHVALNRQRDGRRTLGLSVPLYYLPETDAVVTRPCCRDPRTAYVRPNGTTKT